MKVGIGQLTATACLKTNGIRAGLLVEQAFKAGCKMLFLPEASDYIAESPEQTVSLSQPINTSPFVAELRKKLVDFPLYISVGLHEPTTPVSSRVCNSLVCLDPSGEVINRYQKIHLFDADVPNGPILRESKSVERGTKLPSLIEIDAMKLGPQICYDIRFPETALELRKLGANVLMYPSAFTVKTGEAHWTLLNRARAIDNQCFVISAAQAGKHDAAGKRQSYGHSIAVDPWGKILAESYSASEDLLLVDLDFERINSVRGNMPLFEQREQTTYN